MDNNKVLRILVVLPLYGGSLPVGRFCVSALEKMGHLVETFEAPDFYGAYNAIDDLKVISDRHQYLRNSYLNMLSQAVLAKVETFEPDMVLAMAQAPLTHQALKRLRKDNVKTAMWFVEDFRLFTYWQSFAPFYDVFAVIQKEPFFNELQQIGVENVLYLPLAAHPDFHKPEQLNSIDARKYGGDVSFMGAGYPNRRLAFRKLIHHGLKIWGSEWDGDHVLEPYVQLEGRRVSSDECVKIFNGTKINLNLHSSINADELVSGGDFINPRTFELAACGAFQLVDKRTLMPEAFDDGELAHFENLEDLDLKIGHFLAHPEERESYVEKARARVLKDHTYEVRMQSLIDFTAERFSDWPVERNSEALFNDDFPDELKKDIVMLIEKLGLPANVEFDDLVTAIRSQQGQLSSLDTAVLFLDEWKKIYNR
ncbi:CgeB family protein [Maridesulfovibrio salexigens]|uniref:CgeB family protein n=1 Tax=Maridesulfovibrio salexigens (strain ATCC 14822 / DSM 2638 / NCIMB 8403 / VKM B-1763) TaxID=526222 RepID=C6BV51_MARSD|nr:glycosyltransferase [Maridesulfovibrio salexigens]ACS80026.1 CgeB family protein [Maridesulfovibrio salexigens DSM 2638]